MKLTKLAIALTLTATTSAAIAAPNPSPSAYDRIQDSRADVTRDLINDHQNQITQNKVDSESRDAGLQTQITNVADDLNSTKTGVLVLNDFVQTNATDIQGLKDRADVTDTTLADHDQRITANTDAIALKASQADFDQALSDQAGVDRAQDQLTQDLFADTQTKLAGKVDQTAYDADKAATASTLADHDTRITSTTNALATKVDDSTFQQRAADLDTRIAESKAAQAQTNAKVAQNTADIANHEQRIQSLESNTNAKFADLNKQIDDNRKRASAGIAGVAAMANIPQVLEHQTFAIGAGAGNTDGESALAVGFSARASQNTVVKASVSNDTQHNFVVGAGISYGW